MKKLISIAVLVTLISGCQTVEDFVGTGPIHLSTALQKHFNEKYLSGPGPAYYIIPSDGSAAYGSYCPSGAGTCQFDVIALDSLAQCERDTDQKCYVFAEGERIVWKGLVSFPNGSFVGQEWNQFKSRKDYSSGTIADLSDAALCALAFTNGETIKTESASHYVAEANKRGLTADFCNQTTASTKNNGFVPHANLKDAYVCHFALDQRTENPVWARSSSHIKYVKIAKDRGLTPKECYDIYLKKF